MKNNRIIFDNRILLTRAARRVSESYLVDGLEMDGTSACTIKFKSEVAMSMFHINYSIIIQYNSDIIIFPQQNDI
jgi:hypothetical protein